MTKLKHRAKQLWGIVFLIGANLIPAERPPNIILILVDDLGWSELGCYGDDFFETPHLDRLAAEGMRFTEAYAPAPICSASRASLLTGRTPARTGFEFVVKSPGSPLAIHNTQLLPPPFTADLPLEEVTISEVLQPAGYATGYFGKWHLNAHTGGYLGWSPTHGPLNQGFESGSADFGAHPYAYRDREFGAFAPGEFPTDAMTENVIGFMEAHRDKSFYLVYSSFYPHEPVHTRCEWLYQKYADKPDSQGTAGDRAMYGAFVEQMDHYIGQLLAAIDTLGLAENTLVVFTSDNGNSPLYQRRNILRGSKWDLYEGGIRVPLIARWPGRIAPAAINPTPVHGVDLFPTFCDVAETRPPAAVARDGRSLLPLFADKPDDAWSQRPLYWHYPYYHSRINMARPQSAIRRGEYKLILFHEDQTTQLYNVHLDPGETNDLSKPQSDLADRMRLQLLEYLQDTGARLPTRNPDHDPNQGWRF